MALRSKVETLLDSCLAANSKKTYDRVWQVFHAFHMGTYGVVGTQPLTPDMVAMIQKYVSVLSHKHDNLAGEEDPTTNFWVRNVVEMAGAQACTLRVKCPITLEILRKILRAAKLVLQIMKHLS